ncbi:ATP-dependent DNA ligase [Arthrobacter bambusae]|uniref:ATP-dependent DNA ligase n=1 Tax=Arthrobacter bambusae TaxID=1338426 RepID=UPI001F50A7EF|nr:ATP-dependent DNA ligase [Arthrobacter bambusae]
MALALAKAVESIPHETALPGGSVYEMKFDGFRAVCLVGADGVWLFSRQNKDLGRYFPEVLAAVAEQVPPGCVVDGELVLWSGDRLDFDGLQLRLVTARAALPALVRDHPASFVAFDVLAVAGHDTRGLPFTDRRALLEELARHWVPPLNLSPVTRDRAVAETWFKEMPATGVEGVLAKAGAQAYEPRRIWLKVKARNVTDVVCAGVVGPMARPETAVVGLPMRGKLRIVGRSTALSARAGRDLARYLHPPRGDHPWPEEISGGVLDRFTKESGTVHLTLVEPLVVEVSADVAWSGRAFRHAVRLVRVRPELDPAAVQFPGHLPGLEGE